MCTFVLQVTANVSAPVYCALEGMISPTHGPSAAHRLLSGSLVRAVVPSTLSERSKSWNANHWKEVPFLFSAAASLKWHVGRHRMVLDSRETGPEPGRSEGAGRPGGLAFVPGFQAGARTPRPTGQLGLPGTRPASVGAGLFCVECRPAARARRPRVFATSTERRCGVWRKLFLSRVP